MWLEKYNENKMDDPEKLFVRTEKIYGMSADGTHADSAAIHITYANQLDETRMLKNVVLWSPQQPKLYPIKVGELTVKHGVRSFSYDAKRGLWSCATVIIQVSFHIVSVIQSDESGRDPSNLCPSVSRFLQSLDGWLPWRDNLH